MPNLPNLAVMNNLTEISVEKQIPEEQLRAINDLLPDETNDQRLFVLTLSNVRDRLILDSTDSASPVKRLITMYNATGIAAQKASRRKAKVIAQKVDRMREIPTSCIDLNNEIGIKAIGIARELQNNDDSPADSDGNTPRQFENDDDIGWSSDELSVEKFSNDQSPLRLSPLKPGPVDISQEGGADMNEVYWEIANFNLDEAIYESSTFHYADQSWNFSFGHNNADGYGYILCLHHPQTDPLHLQCTFKMHKPSCSPYSKAREEAYVFGINSMNSRGFVNFASTEAVRRHIHNNGNLRLSITMKVVSGNPQSKTSSPLKNTIGEIFEGCYHQGAETKSNLTKINRYPTTVHSTDFMKEISQSRNSRSLLREADCPTNFHYKAKSLKTANDDFDGSEEHDRISPSDSCCRNPGYADGPHSISPSKRLVCPISFQPFIAFKGLYCTSNDDDDPHAMIDGSQRSPTGLIAPPYLPIILDEITSSNIADTTDDNESESGYCGLPGDFAEIGNFVSNPRRYKKESGITKDIGGREIMRVKGAKVPDLYWTHGNDALANEHNSIVDDHTIGEIETPILSSSYDEETHEGFQESTTSEGSLSPQPQGLSIVTASPVISVKIAKNSCNLPGATGDSLDLLGNLFLPCIRGRSHDLLADSLKTIAQHSGEDEVDPTLLVATNGAHQISKHISLTLPFRESSYLSNKLDDPIETATTAEIGDDGSSNNFDKNQRYSTTYNHKNCPSPYANIHSTLNADAEISPMSPPSYTSLNERYFSGNTTADDVITTLPTIFEAPFGSKQADDNRGLLNIVPLTEIPYNVTSTHKNFSNHNGYQFKRSRIGENDRSRDQLLKMQKYRSDLKKIDNADISKSKHGKKFRPVIHSNRRTTIEDSRTFYGDYKRTRNLADKSNVMFEHSNIPKSLKYPLKVMKKIVLKTKQDHPSKKIYIQSTRSNHTVHSIIIALTGVLFSQSHVTESGLFVAGLAYLIIIAALKCVALMVIVVFMMALDQKKVEKRRCYGAEKIL